MITMISLSKYSVYDEKEKKNIVCNLFPNQSLMYDWDLVTRPIRCHWRKSIKKIIAI